MKQPIKHWKQTDTMMSLLEDERVVWQYNFDPREGKPYFHPVTNPQDQTLTALRPADHPWHRGIWWSWKFPNGVNDWEENKDGVSDGLTALRETCIQKRPDFSVVIEQRLEYVPLLGEYRRLEITTGTSHGIARLRRWHRSSSTAHPYRVSRAVCPSAAMPGYRSGSAPMQAGCVTARGGPTPRLFTAKVRVGWNTTASASRRNDHPSGMCGAIRCIISARPSCLMDQWN